MAQSDFTVLTASLSTTVCKRGPSTIFGAAPGGTPDTHIFSTVSDVTGAAGLFYSRVSEPDFNPVVAGATVEGVLYRDSSTGLGCSTFLFAGAQGTAITDSAYLIGLADADPAPIIIRKGPISQGIPDLTPDPAVNGVLMRTVETFSRATFVQVKMEVIVQANGDVILTGRLNDLTAPGADVDTPSYVVPSGFEGTISAVTGFVDDFGQISTGTAPLVGGRAGFGFAADGLGRRGAIDVFRFARHAAP